MAEIVFTKQAIQDIEDIALYVSIDSVHYASLEVKKIFKKAESLELQPSIGRIVPELKIKSVREVIEGNYRIIYRIVNKDLIHILTVYHSRRQLKPVNLRRIVKRDK